MRKHEIWKQTITMSLAALLALAPAMPSAQETSAPKQPPKKSIAASVTTSAKASPVTAEEGEAAALAKDEKPSGGPHEGIKVHGHWTIQVLNQDGSVARRTEFENSLTGNGAGSLVSILSRTASLGGWAIQVYDANAAEHLCSDASFAPVPCTITSSQYQSILPPFGNFYNLFYPPNQPAGTMTLSGSLTVSPVQTPGVTSLSITSVTTLVEICFPKSIKIFPGDLSAVLPACPASTGPNFQTFTAVQLTTPVTVEPGRIVQVTVSLSFS